MATLAGEILDEAIEEETEDAMIWSLHELKRDIIDGVKGKCDLDD